jgi:uncharacterized protein YodC (DUF2158 family)
MKMDFKSGDLAKLKSGGPLMTISEIIDDEEAICIWFIQDERKEATFEICTLTKVNEGLNEKADVNCCFLPSVLWSCICPIKTNYGV